MVGRMTVTEVDVKAERRWRRLKIWGGTLGAFVILAGGSGMAWYLTPPAMPETFEQAQAVVESPRYQRLSKDAKQPYLDVIREQFGSVDREVRQALMRENEAMRQALRESRDAERDAYTKAYVLATPEQREAMNQEREAEREARRGERGGGEGRGGGGEGRGRGDGPSNERVNERATNGSAQNSQLRGEMRAERRKQKEAQEKKGS